MTAGHTGQRIIVHCTQRAYCRVAVLLKILFMRSLYFIIAVVLCTGYNSVACDLCGCSANNQYLGILPQFYKQFIGVQYQYTSFNARQASLMDPAEYETAYEFSNTVQLWGRYYI